MYKFNALTGRFDLVNSTTSLDDTYVNTSGDTMTGDLEYPVTGFIMNCGSKRYRVTVDCLGALVTEEIVVVTLGTPLGPGIFLWLTNP